MADTPRPLPPGLLLSDEWLIQMVREGRVDADIGGELGLSAGEVRDRIALVASKLDVDGRPGIQRYFGTEQGSRSNGVPGGSARRRWPPRRLLWLAAALVALGGVATVTTVALTRGSGNSQTPANATAEAQTVVAAAASATASAENPGGWFDAGPMFFVDGTTQPVLAESVRAGFTAVTMAGPGRVELDAGNVKWISGAKSVVGPAVIGLATGTIDGHGADLVVQAGGSTKLIADTSETIRFFGINGNIHPILLIRVNIAARNLATAGADGRLFINPAPVPPDAVINADTGEQLDVSGAARLSLEMHNDGLTRCGAAANDNGGQCFVEWLGGDVFLAPGGGSLACSPLGKWQLTTSNFVLDFEGTKQTLPPTITGPSLNCNRPSGDPLAVRAGVDTIGDAGTVFVVTATSVDGQTPESVAIGDDGVMYAGPIYPTVGCPCIAGP